MADLYDVHNARFQQPTDEDLDQFLKEHFAVTDEATPEPVAGPAAPIIAALTVPFRRDQISQRKIGGRMLDYVEGHEYITRLNEASPAWSFRMTKSDMQPLHVTRYDKQTRKPYETDLPCLVVHGELTIPGVGTRAGIGVQMVEDNAGEDVMKGALTDCLKNCAKYFGLGLHMYSGEAPAPAEPSQTPAHVQSPQRASQHGSAPAQRVSDGDYMAGQGTTETQRGAGNRQFAPARPGTGGPATDGQKRALWAISGQSKETIDQWAAEYGESNANLTKGTASVLIDAHGSK